MSWTKNFQEEYQVIEVKELLDNYWSHFAKSPHVFVYRSIITRRILRLAIFLLSPRKRSWALILSVPTSGHIAHLMQCAVTNVYIDKMMLLVEQALMPLIIQLSGFLLSLRCNSINEGGNYVSFKIGRFG
jgi:hypothetical protein